METATIIFLINMITTWYLVGLIWTIQVVHYPLMAGVGDDQFVSYQSRHMNLMTWIVAGPMIIEAGSSLLLIWIRPLQLSLLPALAGLMLVGVIWTSTFLIQVPCHSKLAEGFDRIIHQRLTRTNWIRTAAWTARGGLTVWMLYDVVSLSHGVLTPG